MNYEYKFLIRECKDEGGGVISGVKRCGVLLSLTVSVVIGYYFPLHSVR